MYYIIYYIKWSCQRSLALPPSGGHQECGRFRHGKWEIYRKTMGNHQKVLWKIAIWMICLLKIVIFHSYIVCQRVYHVIYFKCIHIDNDYQICDVHQQYVCLFTYNHMGIVYVSIPSRKKQREVVLQYKFVEYLSGIPPSGRLT